MVRQQFQVLQAALEDEKLRSKDLCAEVERECSESSRIRARLAQVEEVVYLFLPARTPAVGVLLVPAVLVPARGSARHPSQSRADISALLACPVRVPFVFAVGMCFER
jgi:hypothetical protein